MYALIVDADDTHTVEAIPHGEIAFTAWSGTFTIPDTIEYREALTKKDALEIIGKHGLPDYLFVAYQLKDGTGLEFMNELIEQHINNIIDLINIKKFHPCTGQYEPDERLRNVWWKFHENYLNKRELEKAAEKELHRGW